LIQTDWSRNWNTDEYFEGHPYLTEQAALYLKNNGAKLVGIDSFNIDDVSGEERPVHSTILVAEILIVEHMCNLNSVPVSGFTFYAVPVKAKGFGTFPVRAFVEIETLQTHASGSSKVGPLMCGVKQFYVWNLLKGLLDVPRLLFMWCCQS
jgi:kynurenine formamidase